MLHGWAHTVLQVCIRVGRVLVKAFISTLDAVRGSKG